MELKGCAGATTPPETTGASHMLQPDRLPTPLLLSQPLRRGGFDQSFALPSTYEHKSPLHTETGSCSPSLSIWDALFPHVMGKLLMWSCRSPSCCSPNSCLIKQNHHDCEQTLQNPHLPTGTSQTTGLLVATAPPRQGGTQN